MNNQPRSAPRSDAEVGALVRERRLAIGASMDRLAEAAGVSVKTIRMTERGTHWPQARSRKGLEEALGWMEGSLQAAREGFTPRCVEDLGGPILDEPAPQSAPQRPMRLVREEATPARASSAADAWMALTAPEEPASAAEEIAMLRDLIRSQHEVIAVLTAEIRRLKE